MYKVIIVDDESIIKEALRNFIDWNALDCEIVFQSSNGLEVKEKLKETSADIIIADIRMPGMNGIELAEYVYKNYPNIKVIILTGYADFTYAQSAIKLGVVDYVIKSNLLENITNAIIKAIKMIMEQENKAKELEYMRNEINSNISEVKEKFLLDIIYGHITDTEAIKQRAKALGISLHNYYLLTFEFSNEANLLLSNNIEQKNRFINSVSNFISMAFKSYPHLNFRLDGNLLCTVVSFENSDYSKCIHIIISICEEIFGIVDHFMDFSFYIGVSTVHQSINEISAAFNEASLALRNKFYDDSRIFYYLPCNENISSAEKSDTEFKLNKIIEMIKNGETHEAIQYLNELLFIQKEKNISIEQVRIMGTIIYSSCYKYKKNLNSINVEDNINIYNKILNSKTIGELSEILIKVINETSTGFDLSMNKNNSLIEKVIKFITENYNKDISLEQIAKYVHLNSSYLSRLYKNVTGETVVDTINKLRIDKAKDLLIHTDHKTYEIANEIGIPDPAYFSNLFKKHTGQSPKDFRYR